MTEDRRRYLQGELEGALKSEESDQEIRDWFARNPFMNEPGHPANVRISTTPRSRQGILEVWDRHRYEMVSAEVPRRAKK